MINITIEIIWATIGRWCEVLSLYMLSIGVLQIKPGTGWTSKNGCYYLYFKLECAQESPGDLVKMQILSSVILTFLVRFTFFLPLSFGNKIVQISEELKFSEEAYGPNFLFLCPQNSLFKNSVNICKERGVSPIVFCYFPLNFNLKWEWN